MADHPHKSAPPLPPLPRNHPSRAQIHTGASSRSTVPSDQQVTASSTLFDRAASDPAVRASSRLCLFDRTSDSCYSGSEALLDASYQLTSSRASQIETLGIGSTLASSRQLCTIDGRELVGLSATASELVSMRDPIPSHLLPQPHTVMGMRGRYSAGLLEQHPLSGEKDSSFRALQHKTRGNHDICPQLSPPASTPHLRLRPPPSQHPLRVHVLPSPLSAGKVKCSSKPCA